MEEPAIFRMGGMNTNMSPRMGLGLVCTLIYYKQFTPYGVIQKTYA